MVVVKGWLTAGHVVIMGIFMLLQHVNGGTVSEQQLTALQTLYMSTNGLYWIFQPNYTAYGVPWDVTDPSANPCLDRWQGVTCSANCSTAPTCNVTALALPEFNMSGPLNPELTGLVALTSIDFSKNALVGTIPSAFGSFSALTELSMPFNGLSGSLPVELTYARSLALLDLSKNRISGSLPSELGNLSRLT
jgi:hypothetical protein